MEDKRTAIAIFLCIVVVMVYSEWVMAPYKQAARTKAAVTQVAQTPAAPGAIPQAGQPQPAAAAPGQPAAPQSLFPSPADIKGAAATTIDASHINATITHLGARVSSFKLKDYKAYLNADEPLDVVSPVEGAPLPLGVYVGSMSDASVAYTLETTSAGCQKKDAGFILAPQEDCIMTFQGALPNGINIKKRITFRPASYLLSVDVTLDRPLADGSRIWLEWARPTPGHTADAQYNPVHLSLLGNNNKITHVPVADIQPVYTDLGSNIWASISDNYFMETLIPAVSGNTVNTAGEKGPKVINVRVSGTDTQGNFSVYVGPKFYSDLQKVGFQLERNVDLGPFSFVAHPLLACIRFFNHLLGNYGLAIILLTLTIKFVFLPLTKTSFESMKKMQDLQPEIKALRERVQDPTQLNQELMGLYKRRGVNPLGGCLPILIQFPVFLGLYNALQYSIELRHAPFALWITDLSAPERLMIGGFGIPLMVILWTASMFLQQRLSSSAAMDPTQKKVMNIMLVVMSLFFLFGSFPSGLVLYWFVSNLISITQQFYMRSDKKVSAYHATAVASLAIFAVGYVVTLI